MSDKRFKELPFKIELTTYYAIQEPDSGVNEDTKVLMVLHGWGQRCTSFLNKFRSLKSENILIIAPQAPHQFYLDAQSKKVGCNWLTAYNKENSIADNNKYFDAILNHLINEYELSSPKIYVMGFSQGVSMSYRFITNTERSIQGLIACGADIPPDVLDLFPQHENKFPILLAHGKEDQLAPEEVMNLNIKNLEEHNFNFETFIYDGGHEITEELCSKIAEWLRNIV